MRAERLGRIFSPAQGRPWMVSHAAYPTPLLLAKDRLRIYFNTRDAESRGNLAWIDVDPADPFRVLDIAGEPGLGPGPVGTFDDRGISNGSIHRVGDELWLYYMGWNRSVDVPFRNAIGLAVCRDREGRRFERPYPGPLLDRSRFDPFTMTYPFVVPPTGGDAWHMYYGSSRAAGNVDSNFMHPITEATSADGIDWRSTGRDVIALEPGELALTRPWRFVANGGPVLLYSIRRKHYTIGASVIERDGTWTRLTADLLGPSTQDWDDEATCYPAVVELNGARLMFYCGNGFGRTGIGVALIED